MKNVSMSIEDENTLVIRVDLTQRQGLSSTGNTMNIATTSGNIPLPEPHADKRVGLNVYTKEGVPPKAAK